MCRLRRKNIRADAPLTLSTGVWAASRACIETRGKVEFFPCDLSLASGYTQHSDFTLQGSYTEPIVFTQRVFVKKKRFIIPLILLILVGITVLSYWYLYLRGYESTNNAFVDCDDLTVSSKILGRITQLTVSQGDTTSEGQLLVQLDESDLRGSGGAVAGGS